MAFVSRSQTHFIKTMNANPSTPHTGTLRHRMCPRAQAQSSVSQAPLQAVPLPYAEGRASAVVNQAFGAWVHTAEIPWTSSGDKLLKLGFPNPFCSVSSHRTAAFLPWMCLLFLRLWPCSWKGVLILLYPKRKNLKLEVFISIVTKTIQRKGSTGKTLNLCFIF